MHIESGCIFESWGNFTVHVHWFSCCLRLRPDNEAPCSNAFFTEYYIMVLFHIINLSFTQSLAPTASFPRTLQPGLRKPSRFPFIDTYTQEANFLICTNQNSGFLVKPQTWRKKDAAVLLNVASEPSCSRFTARPMCLPQSPPGRTTLIP